MPAAPPPPAGLHVEALSRRFGRRWALARVDLDLEPGGRLLLVGHNGSGKTTLLRCLATALKPHEGTARWDGQDLWADRAVLRPHIALFSHATALYDDLSARQNLQVWARLAGVTVEPAALLERVGLGDRAEPIRTYSAGMKRRLALARVLLKRPRLALFDEPFSALDPSGRALVAGVIEELVADGATLVLSTHFPQLGARFCERAIRLEDGQIAWQGDCDPEALDDPARGLPT